MITLLQYGRQDDLPNFSPFCMKVETFLRMASVAYTVEVKNSPLGTPKGKLPLIKDGEQLIADSSLILDHLTGHYAIGLDSHLSPDLAARGELVKHLLEDHLYWGLLYFRWQADDGWAVTEDLFFADLPIGARQVVPLLARRQTVQALHAQGLGRRARPDIARQMEADIVAVAEIIGKNRYLLGNRPSSYDAIAFAFLANVLSPRWSHEARQAAERHKSLVSYVATMKKRFFA